MRVWPEFVLFGTFFFSFADWYFLYVSDVLYEGSDLIIIKVSRLNMGTYLCIANNGIPPNAVRKVMLHVHCKYSFKI